jgi:hypothetical protein
MKMSSLTDLFAKWTQAKSQWVNTADDLALATQEHAESKRWLAEIEADIMLAMTEQEIPKAQFEDKVFKRANKEVKVVDEPLARLLIAERGIQDAFMKITQKELKAQGLDRECVSIELHPSLKVEVTDA